MSILKNHHIKYGFTVREAGHILALYAPDGGRICRWGVDGAISAKPIQDAADEYIIKQLIKGALNG